MSEYEWVEKVEKYMQDNYGILSLKIRIIPEYFRDEGESGEEFHMLKSMKRGFSKPVRRDKPFEEEMYDFLNWALETDKMVKIIRND
jgi:hypothetical protein